jgi:hypothetical protein
MGVDQTEQFRQQSYHRLLKQEAKDWACFRLATTGYTDRTVYTLMCYVGRFSFQFSIHAGSSNG